MTVIENKKSIMMDKVLAELKNIISTLVVKLDFVANQYETVDMRSKANEYIAAIKLQDDYNTYVRFNEYSIFKADLGEECVVNKSLIPREKRGEVASYQREFITKSYVERNNYYRSLNGLPDIEDEEFIYLSDIGVEELEGVDITKPIHEMSVQEISIITMSGFLDKLISKYPDKKYLNHIDNETKISIVDARQANNFNILYIYRDKSKQPISEMFIAIYNKTRDYVLDRFYDKAYGFKSPYYDGYMGIFILSITVQRFISNYFTKFINRDFYDKDIIKLLFDSYSLPFYNEIPLSYLQKVAKNLNRLLIYKSTDRVFTDIFKIFDMDNIEICNYVLFKNPRLDNSGKPVLLYREKTELGYQVDTTSELLTCTDTFYGTKQLDDYTNVKQIEEIEFNNKTCKLILMNNGIIVFPDITQDNLFYNIIKSRDTKINEEELLQFNEDCNIKSMYKIKLADGSTAVYLFSKRTNIIYRLTHNSFDKLDFKTLLSIDKGISSIIIKQDDISLKIVFGVNFSESCQIYDQTYHKIGELNEPIVSGDYCDDGLVFAMQSGKLYIYGDNRNNRMLNREAKVFNEFTEVNDVLPKVIDVKLFERGCIFIMADGTVRYTREIPFIDNIAPVHDTDMLEYSNIKTIFDIVLDGKTVYCFLTYSGLLTFTNYSYSEKYGKLLYYSDIPNPTCRYRFIKNICQIKDGVIITTYGTNSTLGYSGENENLNFPFISTLNMINQENDLDINHLQIYKGYMFFSTKNNELYVFRGHELNDLSKFIKGEIIQNIMNLEDQLFILVGKSYMYMIEGSTNEDMSIKKIVMQTGKKILDVIKEGNNYSDLIVFCDDNKYYKLVNDTFINIESYNMYHHMNETTALVRTVKNSTQQIEYLLDINIGVNTFNNIKITNVNNLKRITICDNILFLEEDNISFIKLNTIDSSTREISPVIHEKLSSKRAKSVRINNNLIIYNKSGGISLLRNFIHADRLDTQINEDFVSLFDDSIIREITFDDKNIIKLQDISKYVIYEPIVEEMYDLNFIEIPMNVDDTGKYINDSSYYLGYDLVVNDDRLWGGDRDRNEFIKTILEGEFNYATSKYITINSTYDLMKLNFEVCYMFKMLTELKDAEKYLNVDVKFIGETSLFEVIIGLFALTCKKFGLEGNIPSTITQSMSVLGFNFSTDSQYIAKIIEDSNLYERTPGFKQQDIDIIKNPTLFKNSVEVLNLYLDNSVIYENIYTYMYNSKNITEYNAFKKIEQAQLFSKRSNEIYKIGDKYAETYLDYIRRVNPRLYQLVNDTTDATMVEVLDYLLLALNNFLDSDKFEFLFLNIPSLSLDLIKKFIYYLVDIFKSYTVDLKSMNVIYHINDKRLSNIKMILEEHFHGKFEPYEKTLYIDYLDYLLSEFYYYDKLKLLYEINIDNEFNYDGKSMLFKIFKAIPSVADTVRHSLIDDFADFFHEMRNIWVVNNTESPEGDFGNMLNKYIISLLIQKMDTNDMRHILNIGNANTKNYDKLLEQELFNIINRNDISEILSTIYDSFEITCAMNDKIRILYKDILDQLLVYKNTNEEVLGDFNDTMSQLKSHTKNEDMKYKEQWYFIRTGE